jgi:NAD(P)-dependent dehydrogenase (short-subunit alcohol dehydrogenase family)
MLCGKVAMILGAAIGMSEAIAHQFYKLWSNAAPAFKDFFGEREKG